MPTAQTSIATGIESPCNSVCMVHPLRQLCIGCGRTLDEIACWLELSDTERTQIVSQLPSRVASLRVVTIAPAMKHGDD